MRSWCHHIEEHCPAALQIPANEHCLLPSREQAPPQPIGQGDLVRSRTYTSDLISFALQLSALLWHLWKRLPSWKQVYVPSLPIWSLVVEQEKVISFLKNSLPILSTQNKESTLRKLLNQWRHQPVVTTNVEFPWLHCTNTSWGAKMKNDEIASCLYELWVKDRRDLHDLSVPFQEMPPKY